MPDIDRQRLDSHRRLMDSLDPEGAPTAALVREPDIGGNRLLVLDAAFNPPTLAHWALAQEGARASGADGILLQLSRANVDKQVTGADLGQRVYLVEALAARDDRVGVSVCSHARFLEKAEALARLRPGARAVFAIGYDTLVRLVDPAYYDDLDAALDRLFARAEFAVANRGDHDADEVDACLSRPPQSAYRDRIHEVTLSPSLSGISSSEARERIRRGRDTSDLLHPEVAALIAAMGLYST